MASAVLSRRATRTLHLQARLYCAAASSQKALPQQAPKLCKLENGMVVASIENYSPVSRVALVANAGCRFENADNLGITHCLRLASATSTTESTSFNIARTLEQAGAEFTCSSTREYMFYKVDCLRDNLDMAANILMEMTSAPAFNPWELSDVSNQLRLDLASVQSQPNVLVYDLLHKAAFRETLGRSLYAPDYMVGQYSPQQLLHYMKAYFSTERLALVGVGVDHDELVEQACKFTPFCAASIAHDEAKYSGGEIRLDTGGDLTYVAVAVEGPSLSGKDLLHVAVLQNVLGVSPAIKYSTGSSSLLAQAVAESTCGPTAISCINANYTDSGLFGFYAIAQPKEIEKVVYAAFKQFDSVVTCGLDEQTVARAKKQLKAQIGMYREGGDALLYDLGEQAFGCEVLDTSDLFKFIDGINTSDVTNLAKQFVDTKPSMAAAGNLSQTPYIDSLSR